MSITGTVGSSGNTTVTTVYVPAQVLGINDLPDYDNTVKHDGAPIVWDNASSKYKTAGDIISFSSALITLGATSIDINGAADISGDLGVGGDLTVTGSSTFNGGTLTFGDSASDNVVFGADINSDIIPNTDNTYNLGSSSREWKNLYIDGTAHIDTLDIDNNATVNGNLTCKGNLDLQDNDKIKVGAGDDMQIYHDGSNSYITNDVGALKIATEDSGIVVTIGHTTSEVTVADNLTVTGNFTVSGTTTTVDSTTINIQNAFVFEGATDDDYETTLSTVDPTADRTLLLPNASDTLVGLATTDTLTNKTLTSPTITTPIITEIDSGSTITLDAETDIILDAKGGDIYCKDNGNIFATLSNAGGNLNLKNGSTSALTFSGANVTTVGDLVLTGDNYSAEWSKSSDALVFGDNAKAKFGTGGDLEIYHDGSNSYVKDAGTGDLKIQGASDVVIEDTSGANSAVFNTDAGVELYWRGGSGAGKKIESTQTGATITGDLTISGDDLIMATNTSAYMLVADGTSYNPVAISGDVTIANTGAITLDTVNGNVGSFGTNTAIPTFTVNAKGLITAASTVSLSTALPVTADSGTQAAATELLTDTLNFDGTANQITTAIASSSTTDTITIGMPDDVTIDGILTVTGATVLNGAVTLGNATGDDIVMTGRLASHLVPKTNDTYDLGTTALRYRDLFLSGETINLGGATISSDGSGEVAISGDGVTLPAGSNVGDDKIAAATDFGVPIYKADFFSEAGGLVTRNAVLNFHATTEVFTAFTFEDGTTLVNEIGRELFRF